MNIPLPGWLIGLLIVCAVILVGNLLHFWTLHLNFAV